MKSFSYWAKVFSLSILVIAAIAYLVFVGVMNFFTAGPSSSMGLFYWLCMILHLAIISICILYLFDKIKYWSSLK